MFAGRFSNAPKPTGFGFDVELLYLAWRAKLRMREIPVRWNHFDGSKVSFFRDSVRMFRRSRRAAHARS